ncbi:MAG: tryptophan synthase subunit alpha [Thermoanaerobaculum sp.]|nr:tryptophan synthase subunit alpha [Thermoanaerobaculum sp.]MCX7896170.1 tryptophan synthase subunit alpha [Thermoanaerobaculum sp.]MDW7966606.1 tryptophan synthase subunit alpha [Thermoanaerobaculum sp.]
MSTRIDAAFRRAAKEKRAALIAYITAGDPTPARTLELLRALERGGVDVVELGVPYSDPIADGPINCAAAERALAAGTTLAGVLQTIRELRFTSQLPVVLFSYANPVLAYGLSRFALDAATVGVDGVLLPDVPAEEATPFHQQLRRVGVELVPMLAPTSTRVRVKQAKKLAESFVYFVSHTGVTGPQAQLPTELEAQVRLVRKLTGRRVAVGFGVSKAEQVARVAQFADGVVVGSALVARIAQWGDDPELVGDLQRFVQQLRAATRRG